MVGEPAVMDIICLITEQVKKLGVHDGHDKVEGIISVGDDDEHGRPLISQHVKFHLIIAHDLPKLCDIKGSEPCPAGDQDGLGCLTECDLSRTF